MDLEKFFTEGAKPTPEQERWAEEFLALYAKVAETGRGGGKTWFWRQVIGALARHDYGVRFALDSPLTRFPEIRG